MISKIEIVGKVDKSKLEKLCEKLRSMKSRPEGVYELTCEIERTGEAVSYCNNRLMWLGWKLEEAGIRVKWSEC